MIIYKQNDLFNLKEDSKIGRCAMLSADRFFVLCNGVYHPFHAEVLRIVNQAKGMNLRLGHIWHNTFPDGEPGFSIADYEEVSGKHVIVLACIINANSLCEVHDLISACKHQYGAQSVILALSFMMFRRQDHEEKPEEICRLSLFIKDLKDWGVDSLIVCEPHNVMNTQKFCDRWGVKLFVCNPRQIFAKVISPLVLALGTEKVKFYSPDLGSVGRALEMARLLGCNVLASPKLRTEIGIELVDDERFMTKVYEQFGCDVPVSCDIRECEGLHVFMQEDELATGRTSEETARRLRASGGSSLRLIVTHPVCTHGWKMALFPRRRPQPFESIWLGNTRPRGVNQTEYQGSTGGRVEKVRVEPAMAETLINVMEDIKD